MKIFRRSAPAPAPTLRAAPPAPTPATVTRLAPPDDAVRRPPSPYYVPAALSRIEAPAINLANPNTAITADIQPSATVESKTIGGHQDRARAWLRYSIPLCLAIAASMVIAAVTLYDVPLLSFSALLTFGLAFVLSYTGLLLQYWRHTPEGVALDHTRHLWRYLRTEQAHRHTIEREAWTDQRAITARPEDRR